MEGQWRWTTGEVVAYVNWANGEPNNGGGNEDFMLVYRSAPLTGRWSDAPATHRTDGYVLEIESNPQVLRGGTDSGNGLFVESLLVGMPYVSKASEFLLGSIIPPPATDE